MKAQLWKDFEQYDSGCNLEKGSDARWKRCSRPRRVASFSTFVVTPFHGCFVLFKDSDVEDFRTRADNGAVVHNAFRKTLGRVDEDVMGRSGQLVRPRQVNSWGLVRSNFMDFFQLIRIEFYNFFDFLGRIVKKRRRSQKKGFELQNGPQKCRP